MSNKEHTHTISTRARAGILAVAILILLSPVVLRTLNTARAQSSKIPVPPDAMPSDAVSNCTVTPQQFAGWFSSGTVSVDGPVVPANSITFPHENNCQFYQWSMQMFLWLTSPAPAIYGGGSRVFDSPIFYDVSPADQNGKRYFKLHVPGNFIFSLRADKNGPHGFPLIFAKDGRLLEVHSPKLSPRGKPLVTSASGKQVEAEVSVQDHKAIFRDKNGAVIPKPKLLALTAVAADAVPVQEFIVNGKPIFVDSSENVIDTEEGQADGGVLLSQFAKVKDQQTKALVYYTSEVNDVYAYFLTQTKNTLSPANVANALFPTTQADLDKIVAYAGHPFPDGDALAIEIKAAWVEASTLPDKSKYFTIMANVPIFTPDQGNKEWKQTGQTKRVELALVGLHVVGSTNGHPEMIWATFEHFGNTPDGQYQYCNNAVCSPIQTVQQNTSSRWLFAGVGASGPFNCMNQKVKQMAQSTAQVSIQWNSGLTSPCTATTISASDTIRWKPFGAAYNQQPNSDVSTPQSNTQIISINNATQIPASSTGRGQTGANAEMRNNYFLLGATWTNGGNAPTGIYGSSPSANEIGTSLLANSTMETFKQGNSNLFLNNGSVNGFNCFTCHSVRPTPPQLAPATVLTSHIFCDPRDKTQCLAGLQPLPRSFSGEKKKK
jgi:hypothetical protein